MAETHVPEDTKLAKAAALFFAVGITALIGGAVLGGIMNRGSPPETPYPGVVYPVLVIGVASIVAGVVAFIVYVRKESGPVNEAKKREESAKS